MRFLAVLLLLAAALLAGGCANPETQPSTVPWSQPAAWESNGPAGSMMGR